MNQPVLALIALFVAIEAQPVTAQDAQSAQLPDAQSAYAEARANAQQDLQEGQRQLEADLKWMRSQTPRVGPAVTAVGVASGPSGDAQLATPGPGPTAYPVYDPYSLEGAEQHGLSLKFLTPRLGGMMQPEVFYGKADLRTGVQA
jgi:hypothetical protein